MVKLAYLLVISSLIIWLAVSGCVGNDKSKVNETEKGSNNTSVMTSDVQNGSTNGTLGVTSTGDLEVGLSQTELKELDSDMADLQNLLENSSVGEDIVVENAETGKSENVTGK
jgi:hypothetical protein